MLFFFFDHISVVVTWAVTRFGTCLLLCRMNVFFLSNDSETKLVVFRSCLYIPEKMYCFMCECTVKPLAQELSVYQLLGALTAAHNRDVSVGLSVAG